MLAWLLVFSFWAYPQHPIVPGLPPFNPFLYTYPQPGLSILAERVGMDTNVRLIYPDHENLWVCITMRVARVAWEPRWCFKPVNERSEVYVIHRWPPAPLKNARWEASAFIQWSVQSTDDFGYEETEWVEVK